MLCVLLLKQANQLERRAAFGADDAVSGNRAYGAAGKYNQYIFHSMMRGKLISKSILQ